MTVNELIKKLQKVKNKDDKVVFKRSGHMLHGSLCSIIDWVNTEDIYIEIDMN